jgi:hypothetical protein
MRKKGREVIEFMVLCAPRSGSTWVSNWLTTERTLCLHDPILTHAPEELDAIPCDRTLGLSCSGLPLLADFVNRHPARKVIVHRDLEDVDRSLVNIGLSSLSKAWVGALDKVHGVHINFRDLFSPIMAADIYHYLTKQLFDEPRHHQLVRMHIDPEFNRVAINRDRTRAFRQRVAEALA